MNRGIRVLQTHALPLGYVAVPGGRAFSLPPSAYAHQQPGIQPGARPAAVACKLMRRLWTLLYSMHPQAPGCSNNKWSGRRGSNPLPPPWQGGALPDELRPHIRTAYAVRGASGRNRTNDTRIFSPLLYQLSYRGIWGTNRTLYKDGDPERARTVDLQRDRLAF